MAFREERRVLRRIAAGVTLMIVLAHQASGQDTLSDAAWKADIARRAGARHRVEFERDSVGLLVDTIEVSPTAGAPAFW
jgi:hypothetical protein